MIKKINRKLPAFITAICIVFASISVATSVLADDFVPQNLLRTDLAGTPTCVIKSISTGAVSSHNQFNGAGTVAIIADGDTSTRVDAYGANDWGNNSGIVFELNNAAYCGDAVIYSGYEAYPDTYDVYASDSVDTLYTTASLVGTGIVCTGSQVLIPVNREVKYLAVFLTDYTYNGRIAEIELWSAEEGAGGETQEYSNLLETHNDYAGGILYNRQNGSVSANGKFDQNGAIAVATDKDRETHCDVWGWDANTGVGVLYTLDDVYSIDKIVIYSGFEALPDLYRVYAAADFDTLYTDASLVGANMNCPGLLELDVSTDAKYIAFIFDGDGGRVKEYEVYGSKKSDETFVSENLLTTDLAGVKAIIKNIENGSVSEHNQFNGAGTLAIIADGDRETRVDAYGANDWGNHSGVLFTLNNAAYCGKVSIFAGYEAYPDKYDVYVAEELADLYSDSSRIASGIVCTGEEAAVEVNREVKYLAVFLTDYTYNGRIAEIELWSAEKSDTSDPEPGGDPQPGGDPEPGGDPQPGGDPEPGGDPQPTADNFISRHLAADGAYGILQDVASKSVSDGDRFTAAEKDAVKLAIDGDSEKQFEVWGALDWEYPKNVGVRYSLDAMYKVDFAKITAGTSENPVTFDVYASDSIGTLFADDSKVASAVECGGSEVKVNISKQISCVAFVVTNYNGSAMISEFDLSGDDKAIEKETVTWPEAPNTGNILKNATAKEIIAPNGDYSGSKEYDYRFMDEQTETNLSKLTDGNLEKHYDIWSLTPKDKPGVLYELDKYYDLTHLHAWAGAYGSELITNYGYKVYASDNAETLFKTKNLVFTYSNSDDTTNEFGINVSFKKIKYIAFILTDSSDGAWRMREFAAYGDMSADQSEPPVLTSIIEGIEAEYYGVATDNLADPIYMGASAYIETLTDGKRDPVEFWGGRDTENSKFVFIYDLYANYDLTGVDIFASPDSIEDDSGIHKGIRSAKVYASRKFADLFNTTPVTLKSDYAEKNSPDEEAYLTADAPAEWKNARFIAYVFTIGDWRYGACRLEELKAYGSMSAVQDEEEEEAKLPEYIDVTSGDFVLRIYALDSSDDLTKLDANLKVETYTDGENLDFVNNSLSGYSAVALYKVSLKDSAGTDINTGGRRMRLSLPAGEENVSIACVDSYSAEIVSSGVLDGRITVQTETLRSYAAVIHTASAISSLFSADTVAPLVIAILSLASVVSVAFVIITVLKIKKTK